MRGVVDETGFAEKFEVEKQPIVAYRAAPRKWIQVLFWLLLLESDVEAKPHLFVVSS